MNCSVKIPALGLFAFLGVAIPIRASSIAVTYAFGGTATVVGATATTLTLEADAAGTFLSGNSALNSSWNPITYSDLSVLDLNTGLLNGTFTFLFENGDTLLGNVSEDDSAVDASPTQTGPFTQTLTFTGGTGEFAGATGSVSGDGFVGTTDFSVSGSGSVNVTPEPTPGTLLLSGLALLLAGAWRSGVRHQFESPGLPTLTLFATGRGGLKKYRRIVSTFLVGIIAALAMTGQSTIHSQKYTVYDLGPAGNPFSTASDVNSWGVVVGSDTVSDQGTAQSHAVLWYRDTLLDIKQIADARQPGLLGPNSAGGAINDSGLVLLGGETLAKDPNNENFCGYGTGLQCVAMLWSKGILTPLPNPLGGTNTGFGWLNRKGEVVGYAEDKVHDPQCLSAAPNGTGPQILDFEAVVWGPAPGQFRRLEPLHGDTVSLALGINDLGEAVGISGRCGNTVMPPGNAGPHAVLWDADGTVHDLGSFGGTSNPSILGVGNSAIAINNGGVVVGTSAPPGNTVNQPFIWTQKRGIQHLPLLPGDVVGAGLDINNQGEVVGASISSGGLASGNPSAVVWNHGAEGPVTDLNQFLPSDSPFAALLTAFGINDEGKIVGFGATTSGDVHAFLAVPCEGDESITPDARAQRVPVNLSHRARMLLFGRPGMSK